MEKIINYENLRNFAYVNDKIVSGEIEGIVLDFFGLGCQAMYHEETEFGKYLAENNILLVVPYNNPWAWMNKQAVSYTDEILDVLFERYSLKENTPIVSSGGSMGGQSALVYTRYAKRTPVACITNCPVCDLVFHFTERVDLPRTLYSAFYNEDCTLEEALMSVSPYHLAGEMPNIEYHLFHCDRDGAVNIDKHSRVFVEKMKKQGRDIEFTVVEDRDHCDLTPEATENYRALCRDAILKK